MTDTCVFEFHLNSKIFSYYINIHNCQTYSSIPNLIPDITSSENKSSTQWPWRKGTDEDWSYLPSIYNAYLSGSFRESPQKIHQQPEKWDELTHTSIPPGIPGLIQAWPDRELPDVAGCPTQVPGHNLHWWPRQGARHFLQPGGSMPSIVGISARKLRRYVFFF